MRNILGFVYSERIFKITFMCLCMLFDGVIEAERTTKQHWFCDSEVRGQIVIITLIRNCTRMEFQTTFTFQRIPF